MSGNRLFIIFILFFAISFTYRFYGLMNNHPFWVDEFSTANQARLVVENGFKVFTNPNIFFEPHNALFHFLIGGLYKLFGQSEFITRVPSAFVGSMVPPLLFLIAYRFFNLNTGIIAGLLATTSYFQIVWSRQARGYVMVQLLVILAILLYRNLLDSKKKGALRWVFFLSVLILGIFTHYFFYIFLGALLLHFVFFYRNLAKKILKRKEAWMVILALLFITYLIGSLGGIVNFLKSDNLGTNNVWYYHSFLWREYGLISFLALTGLLIALKKNRNVGVLFGTYLILQLFFLLFLFKPYVTRYLLPIFPILLLLMSYALIELTSKIHRFLPYFLVSFIILNGYKFDIKPNSFYSVNHDFREIALIDYHQVYDLIKKKGKLEKGQTAVIDTWSDRQNWYLGRDFPHSYLFRWIDHPGLTSGIPMKTEFTLNREGEKIIPLSNQRFIGELTDLLKAQKRYPRGFIFIDDSSLPQDVQSYVKKNYKKELYLDHYHIDDNPYSIWPATLYSWGIK